MAVWKHYLDLLKAALKLSRVNNLVIIVITQYLTAIYLIQIDQSILTILRNPGLFMTVLSTVIIAASGYFINDYYDIKIDLINKPEKVVVDREIKRRYVLVAHILFNLIGIAIGLFVGLQIGAISFIAALFLWLYSVSLKRIAFLGNLVVAVLTSSTLLIIALFYRTDNLLVYCYAFFAFGINLVREIIKDIEDLKGDETFGTRSIPVVLGLRTTKWIIYLILLVYVTFIVYFLVAIDLLWLQRYFMMLGIAMVYFIYRLHLADTKRQYTILSNLCKWIILVGVLSMLLIRFL